MPAGSSSINNNKDEVGTRMDEIGTTMAEYCTILTDLNRALDEANSRREKLQNVLKMKCQRKAKLHAQVDEHEVQEQVREKQERTALECIEQLNKDLEVAKEQLEEVKTQNEKLKQLRLNHVSQYEEEMRELSLEFMSMKLLEEGENDARKDIPNELSDIQDEVTKLQEQFNALISDTGSVFQLYTLRSLQNEDNELLEEIRKDIREVRDAEATLKQELELMKQKDTSVAA